MAASVHDRLLERARSEGRPFDELLQYFAMERFLYRLSRSRHSRSFVLKGALMLPLWVGPPSRATRDIDLLSLKSFDIDELVEIVRECAGIPVQDDGILFEGRSVSGQEIRVLAMYQGIRLGLDGTMGRARIVLHVDVGFGDVITPRPVKLTYPTLLDLDAPALMGYTPESAIAEKFEAMVVLDMANSRMKDFMDIWLLANARQFHGPQVSKAIGATFKRRQTPLPSTIPLALTPAFHSSPAKRTQWQAFTRKNRISKTAPPLEEVADKIASLLMPVVDSLAAGKELKALWPPGGPWKAKR